MQNLTLTHPPTYRDADDVAHYVLPIGTPEWRALAWIADRYDSAAILHDGSRHVRSVVVVPAPVAAAYLAALPEDNGNPGQDVPPCAGGPLAAALRLLWETPEGIDAGDAIDADYGVVI